MARSFNGTNSRITGTLASAFTSDADWTVGAWFFPTNNGEGNNGALMTIWTAANAAILGAWRFATGTNFRGIVVHSTTFAETTTSGNPVATGQWNALFCTYRASDKTVRIYVGDLDTAVAEASYSAQTAGVGTPTANPVNIILGNNETQAWTHNGRMESPFIVPWEMTVPEMERFRHGDMSVLYERGSPAFHGWFEPGPGVVDLAKRTPLTQSSVTVIEPPPVALSWGHE